jgi:hypothetical protein
MEQSKFATTVATRAQRSMKIAQADRAFHPIVMSRRCLLIAQRRRGSHLIGLITHLSQAENPAFSGTTSLPSRRVEVVGQACAASTSGRAHPGSRRWRDRPNLAHVLDTAAIVQRVQQRSRRQTPVIGPPGCARAWIEGTDAARARLDESRAPAAAMHSE